MSTTYDFTTGDVIAKIKEIAAGDPGHVYKRVAYGPDNPKGRPCWYVGSDTWEPCIVGQALMSLGVTPEELSKHEGDIAANVCAQLGLSVTDAQDFWLSRVQSLQDTGATWGTAVLSAHQASPTV